MKTQLAKFGFCTLSFCMVLLSGCQNIEPIEEYDVIWKSEDGNTVLETDLKVLGGSDPSFDGVDPTKEKTVEFTYTFDGWSNIFGGAKVDPLPKVSANTTYYAHFESKRNEYLITWKNWDDSVLATTPIEYGTKPVYAGTPTKDGNKQYSYTFDGWSLTKDTEPVELPVVTGPATYYAHFKATINQYTIAFDSKGGSAVSSQTIDYNGKATKPDNPAKDYNEFVKWATDEAGTEEVNFDTYVVQDHDTFYAQWNKKTFKLTNVAYAGQNFRFVKSQVRKDRMVETLGLLRFVVNDDSTLTISGYTDAIVKEYGDDWTDIEKALTHASIRNINSELVKCVDLKVDSTTLTVYISKLESGNYSGTLVVSGTDVSGTFSFGIELA